MSNYEGNNRRRDDGLIQVVAERINTLHTDVGDIKVTLKESMKEMTEAFNKLIKLEEKQVYIIQDISRLEKMAERAHSRIDMGLVDDQQRYEKLEGRIDSLEREAPMNKKTTDWIMSAVYAAAGMLVMFAAKSLGLV